MADENRIDLGIDPSTPAIWNENVGDAEGRFGLVSGPRASFTRSRVVDRISDLVVFIRTAETGNYSEAARLLSLSPSAVSKLVSRLEDRMGFRLFNRTSRALSLTCDGEAFYEKAMRIVVALEEAESIVPTVNEQAAGKLRVHCPPAFATHQLIPLVPDFVAEFPQVRVEFMVGDEPVDPIGANIDVIIQIGALTDSSFIARRIGTSRTMYCASPAYLQRHGGQVDVTMEMLLNIGSSRRVGSRPAADDRQSLRPSLCGGIATNDVEMLRQLALQSMGVARLPDFVVRGDMESGALVRVPGTEDWDDEQPIFAIYQARKNLPARTRAFLDFLGRRVKERPRVGDVSYMAATDTDHPSSERAQTLSLLYAAHLVSAAGFSDHRKAEGLDVTQSRALIALAEYGELTAETLATLIMLKLDVVEDTLALLAGRNLVTCTSSGTVTLTESGRDLQTSVQRQWRRYEEDQLNRFPATDVAVVRRFLASYIRRFGPRWQEH